uniref:Uncharacterized protein n=1 Tax=Oryza nivara TaxID=4536 RepID=A0A0E0I3G5_ORYNI
MWGPHKSYPPLSLSLRECGTVASGGGDLGVALERRQRRAGEGRSGGGGDRDRRGRLAVGRKKTGHENGRVLATLSPVTVLSTTMLHALSAGHDAPASAVLPPRPRTRKGRLRLATATRVGIPSKMAASGGGYSCTCDGGCVEGGRSGAGGGGAAAADGRGRRAEPADNDATTRELGGICVEHSPAGCRGNRQGAIDEDWLDCG